jgi:hypothetical protein
MGGMMSGNEDHRTPTAVDFPGEGPGTLVRESIAMCVVGMQSGSVAEPGNLFVKPLTNATVLLLAPVLGPDGSTVAVRPTILSTNDRGVLMVGKNEEFKLTPGDHEYMYIWSADNKHGQEAAEVMGKLADAFGKAFESATQRPSGRRALAELIADMGFESFHSGFEDLDRILYDTTGHRLFRNVYTSARVDEKETATTGAYSDWLKLAALFGNLVTTNPKGVRGLIEKEKAEQLGLPKTHRYLMALRPAVSLIFLGDILSHMLVQCHRKATESFGPFNAAQAVVHVTQYFEKGNVFIDSLIKATTGSKAQLTVTKPWGNELWDYAPFREYAHKCADPEGKVTRRQFWEAVHAEEAKSPTYPSDLMTQYFDLYRFGYEHMNEEWPKVLEEQKTKLRSIDTPKTVEQVRVLFEKHASFPALIRDVATHLHEYDLGPPATDEGSRKGNARGARHWWLERFLEGAVRFEYCWWESIFPEKTWVRSSRGRAHEKKIRYAPADYSKGNLKTFFAIAFPAGKNTGEVFESFFGSHGWDVVAWLCRMEGGRRSDAFKSLCENVSRFGKILGMKRGARRHLQLRVDWVKLLVHVRTVGAKKGEGGEEGSEEEGGEDEGEDTGEEGEGAEGEEGHGWFKIITERLEPVKETVENRESLEDANEYPEAEEKIRKRRLAAKEWASEAKKEEEEVEELKTPMVGVVKCLMLVQASFELAQALREFDEEHKKDGVRVYVELTEKFASCIEQIGGTLLAVAQHTDLVEKVFLKGSHTTEDVEKFFGKRKVILGTLEKAESVAGTVGDVVGMAKYVYDGAQLLIKGSARKAKGGVDDADIGGMQMGLGGTKAIAGVVGLGVMGGFFLSGGFELLMAASGPIGLVIGLPLLLVEHIVEGEIDRATSRCEKFAEKLEAEMKHVGRGARRPGEKAYEERFKKGAEPFWHLRYDVANAVRVRFAA